MCGQDVRAAQLLDGAAEILRAGAFLLQCLALARGQPRQEVLVIRIAVVFPVKLLSAAGQEVCRCAQARLGFGAEGDMRARQPVLQAQLGHGIQQRCLPLGIGGDQARTSDGGEGHRALQLGIVVAARALERVGPGVVEDVFALTVGFDIAGRDAVQMRVVAQRQMGRVPARALTDRAGILQRGKEAVGGEGVRARAGGIPICGGDLGDMLMDGDAAGHENSLSTRGAMMAVSTAFRPMPMPAKAPAVSLT